jgi:hypothetical protein
MLIQCPSCQARTSLPDEHAGSKVRCAECGCVYVARPRGARRPGARRARLLLGLLGFLTLAALLFFTQGSRGAAAAKAPAAEENGASEEDAAQPGARAEAPAK